MSYCSREYKHFMTHPQALLQALPRHRVETRLCHRHQEDDIRDSG